MPQRNEHWQNVRQHWKTVGSTEDVLGGDPAPVTHIMILTAKNQPGPETFAEEFGWKIPFTNTSSIYQLFSGCPLSPWLHIKFRGENLSTQKDIAALVGGKASVSDPKSHVSLAIQSPHGSWSFLQSTHPISSSRENAHHMPFLLSIPETDLERNSRSWASILTVRSLRGKVTLHSEPKSQDLGSEIKNKLCLQKLDPKADFQVLETPRVHTETGRSLFPLFQRRFPQFWHY